MKKNFLLLKSAKGQSLVELAVSLVVLLFLLAGIVEFGLAFFQFVQLRDAAQEGALYGSTKPSDVNGIIDRIKGSSSTPIDLLTKYNDGTPTQVTVEIKINGYPSGTTEYAARACEANAIEVKVSYTHNVFMPFVCPVIGICNLPLNARVTDTILSPYEATPGTPCDYTIAP
jgi:Flp pilus assembly protein TadG